MLRAAIVFLLATLATGATLAHAQPASPEVEWTLGGKVHADARAFPGSPMGEAPGFLLRRARVEIGVEVDGRFRAVLEPGFGEGEAELVDGYVEADLWRGLAARVGRFKTPVGYESLRSSSDLRFAERAFPTALSPRRDLGVMVTWEASGVEAQAGVFNGVADGASGAGDWGAGPDGAARVFGYPFATDDARLGLGLAVAAGTARGPTDDLADYETSGDRTFLDYVSGVRPDGMRLRLAPQATLDVGRLHVLGEWTLARHRLRSGPRGPVEVEHHAWQAAASVVIAGVPQGDERPVPARSVTDGGPGAIEVSARVHGLALHPSVGSLATDASARRATAAALALHWTPVEAARLGITAERTVFRAFAGDAPPGETFIVLRAQLDL